MRIFWSVFEEFNSESEEDNNENFQHELKPKILKILELILEHKSGI